MKIAIYLDVKQADILTKKVFHDKFTEKKPWLLSQIHNISIHWISHSFLRHTKNTKEINFLLF